MTKGYKTTEFWVAVVLSIIGMIMASGVFVEGGKALQVLGFIVTAANGLGYTISRGLAKMNGG